MTTFILPGVSEHNKDWAQEVKARLEPEFPCKVVYWKHWETGIKEPGWIEEEAEKIIKEITSGNGVNIIAKSAGTAVAMIVLQKASRLVARIILCGIPIADFNGDDEKYYSSLASFPPENVLVVQNELDPHSFGREVKRLLLAINPNIKFLVKPGVATHDYPYFEDFRAFF